MAKTTPIRWWNIGRLEAAWDEIMDRDGWRRSPDGGSWNVITGDRISACANDRIVTDEEPPPWAEKTP